MEGLQEEIEKLMDIIAVLIVKLEAAAMNDAVSDIKMILDKSRNEVQQIQESLLEKIKQEGYDSNEDDMLDSNSFSDIIKEEEAGEPTNKKDITEEKSISNAVKIDFVKKTRKESEHIQHFPEKHNDEEDSTFYKIMKCIHCDFVPQSIIQQKCHYKEVHHSISKKIDRISITYYICKKCGHRSHRVPEAQQHFKDKHREDLKFCDDCGRQYETFDEHICKASQFRTISKCIKCDFIVSSDSELKQHFQEVHFSKSEMITVKKHTISLYHECIRCQYTSKIKSNIVRHFQTMHNLSSETCHICGYVCNSKASLKSHIHYKHKAPEGQTKCQKCLKCFPNVEFDGHLCERSKVMCNICGKAFGEKSKLKRHIMVEHEKVVLPKPFFCHKCDYSCESNAMLKVHMKTHEEKKPCPECGIKVRHLKEHIAVAHTPDQMKKHQCPDCGKGFLDSGKLNKHKMNVHLKLRPYNCRYGCNISYNDLSNRNQHEKKTHGKIFTTAREEKLKARLQSSP